MNPLLKQYGRILNWCHAFGFTPFKWSPKKQEVTILEGVEKKWSGLTSKAKILFPIVQTIFMTFQAVRAAIGATDTIPVVRKMQMVYYAMGYTSFNVNFVPVFQRGGLATATVINNLVGIENRCADGQ